jgi:hypothetical protein
MCRSSVEGVCRGCRTSPLPLRTSADGTTWSPVSRIPIDTIGSNVDHFIPGLAVSRASGGAQTALALTYYFQQPTGCVGSTCTIQVGFVSSLDNGQTWSSPLKLSDPMQLAPTNQGAMVGDYISTSFLAGQQRVVGAFAIGFPPSGTTAQRRRRPIAAFDALACQCMPET